MSQENVKNFFDRITADKELQEQISVFAEKFPKEQFDQKIVEMGEEHGYSFSLEEMKAYEKELVMRLIESGELPQEKVEDVAGGLSEYHQQIFKPTVIRRNIVDRLKNKERPKPDFSPNEFL